LASGPDSASWIAARVLPTLLYGREHPYALPEDGFAETVEKLDVEDVTSYYRQRFAPAHSVLIVVGDLELDATVQLLEETLGSWTGEAVEQTVAAAAADSEPDTVYLVHKPGAVQSVIAAGRTWKGRDDSSYYATRIGNRIFGGDFLSRLNQNLRQQHGFTYGARSGFDYFTRGGIWTLSTAVRAEVTGAALGEIARELHDAAGNRPLTDEEVSEARSAEISVLPQSFETPSGIAAALIQLAVHRLPPADLGHFEDRLAAVPAREVAQSTAELVDTRQIRMLVVGDQDIVQPLLRAAGFAALKILDADGHPLPDSDKTQ
jgi:predicted Zn-dependent peptidase